MSDTPATPAAAPETVSKADYEAAVERARRFEGQLTDKEKTLAEYAKYGDPKAIAALKGDYDNIRKNSAKTPEEITALLEEKEGEVAKRFDSKLTETEKRALAAEQKVQKYEVVVPTMNKAASLFVDTSLDLVNMLVERDLASVDGRIIVKDSEGKPAFSAKNPREHMGVDEWLEGIAAKYPSIAKAKTVGTGKEPGSTSETNGTTTQAIPSGFETWPQTQQKEWFTANPKALEAFMQNKL